MPGKYNPETRQITLETSLEAEPLLATATLINKVVADLLVTQKFAYAHFPELVDLAVVATGLGIPQSNISFVNSSGSFWDSTRWDAFPRSVLDAQSLAYASALMAWIRGEEDPDWTDDLPAEVKRPMQKSLKYLCKTGDSFFNSKTISEPVLQSSHERWLSLAKSDNVSGQVIALRLLGNNDELAQEKEALIAEKLRSTNRTVLLHAIVAAENILTQDESVCEELRLLTEYRDDEVRAKAMFALAKLNQLNGECIRIASKMLESPSKFVVFSGLIALSSLDSIPQQVFPSVDRALLRALQSCDLEFVSFFVAGYCRWLDDPKAHFDNLLQDDSPEYLELVNDAMVNLKERLVSLQD